MAYTYLAGERKVRPGVYQRVSKLESSTGAGAINGVVAFVINAAWGPVDKVTTHETAKSIRDTYGAGDSVDAACAIIEAGATTVYIKRVTGTNGTAGAAEIGTVVKLESKYPGARALVVKIKEKAGDATTKQIVVLEGVSVIETLEFTAGQADETAAFIEAVAESKYITATKLTDGVIVNGEYELNGTNPTVTAADYADAYYALEPFRYNVMVTDSISTDVFATLCAYAEESYDTGKMSMFVGGTDTKVPLNTRMNNAKACNSARIVYFGGAWEDNSGNIVSGVKAIAYVAGLIAATPANKSIVHASIAGATDVPEKLTNAEYVNAIKNGLLLVSVGSDGQVWFDSGINTLINPNAEQDEGWKKIRRVKTRYELMDRIDRVVAPQVGKINCDKDGIAFIIQMATGIIKDMIAEGKLSAGTFYEDPENPFEADSAWFVIDCDDIDSLEKIYLHYRFRYSAN